MLMACATQVCQMKTGLRCRVNDAIGLYTCMKEYYQHPEKRKEHGIAGRRRVETILRP
jgi:hypothetical protein